MNSTVTFSFVFINVDEIISDVFSLHGIVKSNKLIMNPNDTGMIYFIVTLRWVAQVQNLMESQYV